MIENARSGRLAASMSPPLFSSAGKGSCAPTWICRDGMMSLYSYGYNASMPGYAIIDLIPVERDAIAGGR
jgi:hypothetical protein